MNYHRLFVIFGLLLAPLAAAQSNVTLHHVHGLAYSADGKSLMVPSHHGLAVFRDGKWAKAPGPEHDYMGFAATKTRLYSSGHPAPDSGLKNPFGLIRSKDGGATWDKLGLEGESDFHLLATSWHTNAVYVWNSEPNSRMRQIGLHFTMNDGSQWERAAAKGLTGQPRALAVHPKDARTAAVTTSAGVFVSRNAGDSFEPVTRNAEGLAVFFDLDANYLWYSSFDGSPRLTIAALDGGVNTSVTLPPLTKDAVSYVAQNPIKEGEYAIATFERSVYVTQNGGKTWRQIARNGKGL